MRLVPRLHIVAPSIGGNDMRQGYKTLAIALGLTACVSGEESQLDPLDKDIQDELAQVPDVQLWADRAGLPLFVTGKFGDAGGGAGLVARFYRLSGDDLVLDREDADPET